MQDYHTVTQAAEVFNCTTRTIQRWVKAGRFPDAHPLDASQAFSPIIIPNSNVEAELARQAKKAEK